VDEEAVLLDLGGDRYFALSASAAQLWALLEKPRTARELAEAVTATFDVDGQTALADVRRWLDDLLRLDLVRPAD
jgi:hypothetical protein